MSGNALVPSGTRIDLSVGERLINSFLLRKVMSRQDRFGFVSHLSLEVADRNGKPCTLTICRDTPLREVISLLALPRQPDGSVFGEYMIPIQNSMFLEVNGEAAFIVPHGALPWTDQHPTCPHCQDNEGRMTALQLIDNRLRCPNPHCPARVKERIIHFLMKNLLMVSETLVYGINQDPAAFGSIDRLFDEESILTNRLIEGSDRENCFTIARNTADMFYNRGNNANYYVTAAANFLMSLSIPGLTQQMVNDVIAQIMYGTPPEYLLTLLGENIADVAQNRIKSTTLPSFRAGHFPSYQELEPYLTELSRIEQILYKYRGVGW